LLLVWVALPLLQPEVVNFLLESNCDMNLQYKPPPPKKASRHEAQNTYRSHLALLPCILQ
jgi:hypothetical protein